MLMLLPLALIFSCAAAKERAGHPSLVLAVLSNTFPESPFVGFPDALPRAVEEINVDNPHLVIHAGNMVHGGDDWMGIKLHDMERQFRKFNQALSALNSIVFTAVGDRDLFNGSTDLYRRYTGRPDYYSFNYGSLHFIVLKTSLKFPDLLDPAQEAWLRKDLEQYRRSGSIIVIGHHPVQVPERGGKTNQRAEGLHRLFSLYPVKICISAAEGDAWRVRVAGIEYISAGCGGYNDESRQKNDRHYYIIDWDGSTVKVAEKTMTKQGG